MTIKECIDIVDANKPNQYTIKDKVTWLSFIEGIIINEVLKTHEGYDGRYDLFEGYSEDKISVTLIVPSPYDRLYTAYLNMMIDQKNGEMARYNNSASLYNTYMMEYRKYYHKTHLPLSTSSKTNSVPLNKTNIGLSDAEYEKLKTDMTYILTEYFSDSVSPDKLYDIVNSFAQNNIEMLKGKDGRDGIDGKDGYTPRKNIDYFDGKNGAKGDKGYTPQKRVDYWTEEDVAEINSYIDKQADAIQSELNKQIDSFSDENLIQVVDAVINEDGTEDESQFYSLGTGGNIYYVREVDNGIYVQGGYFLFKITDNQSASTEMMVKLTHHSISTRYAIGPDEWSEWEVHPYSDENFTTLLKEKLNSLPTNDELEEKIDEKADVLQLTTDMSNTHKITDSAEQKIVGIEYYRANLIPYPYAYLNSSTTVSGITFTDNGDGTITINGTATATVYFNPTKKIKVVSGNTYYLSGGTADIAISYQQKKDGVGYDTTKVKADVVSVKANNSWNEIHIILDIPKGTTVDNVTIKPMISLTDSKYEPYIETPTVTLYGKNLLDTRNINRTSARVTFTSNDDGSIHITTGDTTKYGEGFIHIFNPNLTLKAGVTYTFSRDYVGDYVSHCYLYSSGSSILGASSTPKSYTPTEDILINSVRLYCEDNKTIVGSDVYLQLEVGEKTEFEKYKDPQTAQGDETLNLTMNYPVTTVVCDCGCKVTYKADSTNAYYNLLDRITTLESAIVNNV